VGYGFSPTLENQSETFNIRNLGYDLTEIDTHATKRCGRKENKSVLHRARSIAWRTTAEGSSRTRLVDENGAST
jgi:hypothetical protein